MLLVYTVSAIVAGVLVLLSLLGFEHSGDADSDVELHGEGEFDGDHGLWLPFFSLRFYTYFFAGLGATGLLLHFLTKTDPTLSAIISASVGLVAGLSVAIAIRLLRITEVSGSATEKDLLGKEAQVMVPIRGPNSGRIRCMVRGDIIDFLAFSEDPEPIEAGQTVIVVAMENGRAQVVKREALFGDDALPLRT